MKIELTDFKTSHGSRSATHSSRHPIRHICLRPDLACAGKRGVRKMERTDCMSTMIQQRHPRTVVRISCAGEPGVRPVKIELTDFKTKEVVDVLEVDACLVATGRAPYTQVPPASISRFWGLGFWGRGLGVGGLGSGVLVQGRAPVAVWGTERPTRRGHQHPCLGCFRSRLGFSDLMAGRAPYVQVPPASRSRV